MRRLVRLLPVLGLAAVAAAFFASGAGSSLSPAGLAAHAQDWRHDAAQEPLASLAIYVTAYAALTAAGLPVALMLTIAGGLVFGAVEGALAASAAANLAALVTYAAARSALAPVLVRRLPAEGRLAGVVAGLRRQGFWPILSARLMPVMPFALVNVASGLARVPLPAFVGATIVGGLPSSFIYGGLGAGLGANLSAGDLGQAARSPLIWAPLLGLSVLSLLPVVIARRARAEGRGA